MYNFMSLDLEEELTPDLGSRSALSCTPSPVGKSPGASPVSLGWHRERAAVIAGVSFDDQPVCDGPGSQSAGNVSKEGPSAPNGGAALAHGKPQESTPPLSLTTPLASARSTLYGSPTAKEMAWILKARAKHGLGDEPEGRWHRGAASGAKAPFEPPVVEAPVGTEASYDQPQARLPQLKAPESVNVNNVTHVAPENAASAAPAPAPNGMHLEPEPARGRRRTKGSVLHEGQGAALPSRKARGKPIVSEGPAHQGNVLRVSDGRTLETYPISRSHVHDEPAPKRQRAARGTAGTFAGRYPPNQEQFPERFEQFEKMRLAFLEARASTPSSSQQVSSTEQLNYWTFVSAAMKTIKHLEPDMCQRDCLKAAVAEWQSSPEGQQRFLSKAAVAQATVDAQAAKHERKASKLAAKEAARQEAAAKQAAKQAAKEAAAAARQAADAAGEGAETQTKATAKAKAKAKAKGKAKTKGAARLDVVAGSEAEAPSVPATGADVTGEPGAGAPEAPSESAAEVPDPTQELGGAALDEGAGEAAAAGPGGEMAGPEAAAARVDAALRQLEGPLSLEEALGDLIDQEASFQVDGDLDE